MVAMVKWLQACSHVMWRLGAVIDLVAVIASVVLHRPLPRTSGRQRFKGLSNHVQVVRDCWGIPHIFASNDTDLFTALGYVHAQDRLWQMELNRRVAHGRLSEVLGPTATSSDRFVRVLGLSRVARREVDHGHRVPQ